MRIEVDRPRFEALPLSIATSNYCAFRGMLMKSNISFRGRAGFNLPLTRSARLQIGEHPRVQVLKRLEISSRPLFCGYFPSTEGILDDHIDSWFLSFADAAERCPGRVGERRRPRSKPGVARVAAGPGAR